MQVPGRRTVTMRRTLLVVVAAVVLAGLSGCSSTVSGTPTANLVSEQGLSGAGSASFAGADSNSVSFFAWTPQQIDTGVQADWLVKDASDSGYGLENVAVDAVGLGVGVVDGLAKQGYKAKEFMSGARPDPNVKLEAGDSIPMTFDNLRSQMIYLYARGIELGIIKHYSGCPFLKELQKEAMVHNFEITDKVLRVESKDKIKKRLGSSPDLLDAVVMGLYVALRKAPVTFRVRTA